MMRFQWLDLVRDRITGTSRGSRRTQGTGSNDSSSLGTGESLGHGTDSSDGANSVEGSLFTSTNSAVVPISNLVASSIFRNDDEVIVDVDEVDADAQSHLSNEFSIGGILGVAGIRAAQMDVRTNSHDRNTKDAEIMAKEWADDYSIRQILGAQTNDNDTESIYPSTTMLGGTAGFVPSPPKAEKDSEKPVAKKVFSDDIPKKKDEKTGGTSCMCCCGWWLRAPLPIQVATILGFLLFLSAIFLVVAIALASNGDRQNGASSSWTHGDQPGSQALEVEPPTGAPVSETLSGSSAVGGSDADADGTGSYITDPTPHPTRSPTTPSPTPSPVSSDYRAGTPTSKPNKKPHHSPTGFPTRRPTVPTAMPSLQPTTTQGPTAPTTQPTLFPTNLPTTTLLPSTSFYPTTEKHFKKIKKQKRKEVKAKKQKKEKEDKVKKGKNPDGAGNDTNDDDDDAPTTSPSGAPVSYVRGL